LDDAIQRKAHPSVSLGSVQPDDTARFDVNQSSGNMDNAGTFGRYSGTLTQPRVMQFSLRYEF